MLKRLGIAAALLPLVAQPATAQVGARRVRPKAFPLAVTPYVALGFRGTRSQEADPVTCPNQPDECHQHKVSSGPALGVDVQIPIASTFGLLVGASASRPHRSRCTRGAQCDTRETLTGLRGSALVVFRFKARVPVFFGLGVAALRYSPGAVRGQTAAGTEVGGALMIAYDFALRQRVGGRVALAYYGMKPENQGLPTSDRAVGLARDLLFTIGASIRLTP